MEFNNKFRKSPWYNEIKRTAGVAVEMFDGTNVKRLTQYCVKRFR
jgi:hypothetical protein